MSEYMEQVINEGKLKAKSQEESYCFTRFFKFMNKTFIDYETIH